MLCTRCHKNEATVYYSQTVNGQKQEMHICSECANELGLNMGPSMFHMGNFLNGLLGKGISNAAAPVQSSMHTRPACSACGMRLDDFARTGLFGCPACYDVFKPYLPETLKKIHGSAEHTGKIPLRLQGKVHVRSRLEALKVDLNNAIANEEFERAAILRDEIRTLEAEQDNGGEGK